MSKADPKGNNIDEDENAKGGRLDPSSSDDPEGNDSDEEENAKRRRLYISSSDEDDDNYEEHSWMIFTLNTKYKL